MTDPTRGGQLRPHEGIRLVPRQETQEATWLPIGVVLLVASLVGGLMGMAL